MKKNSNGSSITLWHTTEHENVQQILREGFKDSVHVNREALGDVRNVHTAGVWVGNVPAIDDELFDGIGLFGFNAMTQAFIAIDCKPGICGQHWIDGTWPGKQWLVLAKDLNVYPRREVSLDEIIRLRLRGNRDDVTRWVKHDRGYGMDFVECVRNVLKSMK